MADHITPIEVAPDTFRRLWNVQINDYEVSGKARDFETLLVDFSTNRASTIEAQVNPLSDRIRKRNNRLSELGQALADLSAAQQTLAPEEMQDKTASIRGDTARILHELSSDYSASATTINKPSCDRAIQLIKTEIDRLNNDASNDMTNLQSLVDKRDESFSTASSLMQAVSDCRSTAIRNIQ